MDAASSAPATVPTSETVSFFVSSLIVGRPPARRLSYIRFEQLTVNSHLPFTAAAAVFVANDRFAVDHGLGRVATWPRLDLYVRAAGHRRAAGGGGMSKRILVVEDQADNRQIIRDMLQRP